MHYNEKKPTALHDSTDVTVLIPTYNNEQQLVATLCSLIRETDFLGDILVINNGESKYEEIQAYVPKDISWIDSEENLGWSRSINEGLKHVKTDLVCMANDDLLFPLDREFWKKLTGWFGYGDCVGVGPVSNYVAGYQNLCLQGMPDMFVAGILIGFFALYRTTALVGAGGLDESLPGGDDFDLSIRLNKAGWKLLVDRRCYIHHHGSQTGRRVHEGYWDSMEHQLATTNALIAKHGLKAWYSSMNQKVHSMDETYRFVDVESCYQEAVIKPSDIFQLLPTLRTFASGCESVTEFGTDDGTSATAFLAAKPKKLTCYDITRKPEVDKLYQMANGTEFKFHQQDVLEADIEPTDLLFVDDLHTYDQVSKELARHHSKVKKYILFHDTETLAEHGEHAETGIRPAIEEFLKAHDEWRIVTMLPQNNGLMGLMRVK